MNVMTVWDRLLHAPLLEVAIGLFSSPVVSFVLAVGFAFAVWALRRQSARDRGVLRGERIALGVIAAAVLLGWIADIVLRGYVFDMSATVSWWRFAVPPLIASVGLLIFAATRGTVSPRRPVGAGSVTRRSWTTFGPRYGILTLVALTVGTITIAILFGRMSFALDSGLAAHVALAVPNIDRPPVVTVFPGWAYGIPLIISVVLLMAATAGGLHRNARRPFSAHLAPDTERAHRSAVARDVTTVAMGTALITLAGLLRMARGAAVSSLITTTDSGVSSAVTVNLPHADLIMVGGFFAPVLELGGCALLALLAVRALGVSVTVMRPSTAPVGVSS